MWPLYDCKNAHILDWTWRKQILSPVFLEVDMKFDKNASLLKHQKIAYCEKLFEYNEVAIRYVAPLKVAPKLGACRDKYAQIT